MGDYCFWFHGFKLYSQNKTRSAGQVEDVASCLPVFYKFPKGSYNYYVCRFQDITIKFYVMVHTNNSLRSFNFVKIGCRSQLIWKTLNFM